MTVQNRLRGTPPTLMGDAVIGLHSDVKETGIYAKMKSIVDMFQDLKPEELKTKYEDSDIAFHECNIQIFILPL